MKNKDIIYIIASLGQLITLTGITAYTLFWLRDLMYMTINAGYSNISSAVGFGFIALICVDYYMQWSKSFQQFMKDNLGDKK